MAVGIVDRWQGTWDMYWHELRNSRKLVVRRDRNDISDISKGGVSSDSSDRSEGGVSSDSSNSSYFKNSSDSYDQKNSPKQISTFLT